MQVNKKKVNAKIYITGIPLEKNMMTKKVDIILERFCSCSNTPPSQRISSCFYSAFWVLGESSIGSSGYFFKWTLYPLSVNLSLIIRRQLLSCQKLAVKALSPRVITRILPTSEYQSDSKPSQLYLGSSSSCGNKLWSFEKLMIRNTRPVLKNSIITIWKKLIWFYSLIVAFFQKAPKALKT